MDDVPDFSRVEFDFSDFHPLDHGILHCSGYPGGQRRHASLQWNYWLRPRLRSATFCRLGRHQFVTAWRRTPDDYLQFRTCYDCHLEPDALRSDR